MNRNIQMMVCMPAGKLVCFLAVCLLCISVRAQQNATRLRLDMNAGIPMVIGSIPFSVSTYGGVGARYNVTKTFSAQLSFNIGTIRGKQSVRYSEAVEEKNGSYTKFRNDFYQYTLKGCVNLENLFKLRTFTGKFKKINPYLTGGIGYTGTFGIVAERYDGRLRSYDNIEFWTVQCGAHVAYLINPSLDLNIGTDINLTQTYFLDGIPMDNKYDHLLMVYVGMSIKLGATKTKPHIEWSRNRVRNVSPKKKPDPRVDIYAIHDLPPNDSTYIASLSGAGIPAVVTKMETIETQRIDDNPVHGNGVFIDAKNGAIKPDVKYNIIVGAFRNKQYAAGYSQKLSAQGFLPVMFKSDINADITRVCIYSTDNRDAAMEMLMKARLEVDKGAWLYVSY